MLTLAPGEVHLWLAYYDRFAQSGLPDSYLELLSDEERAQMARFHFERDRLRYQVTRALVRTTLSRYSLIPAAHWRFTSNEYGRPAISVQHGCDACALHFNVSHTRSLIALAVSREAAVGVDVENVSSRVVTIDIAHRFFSRAEAAELGSLEPHRQQHRFFEYWTLKESYIKARGMGLRIPLDKFTFSYPSDTTVVLETDADLDHAPQRWTFWQLQPDPDYLLALCLEQRCAAVPRLVLQPALPQIAGPLSAAPVELGMVLRRQSPLRSA
jgi:4'-phosphopantetheinyl transferase